MHHEISLVVATSQKCQSTATEDDCEDWEKAKAKARTDPRYCLVPSRPARFARGRCLPPLIRIWTDVPTMSSLPSSRSSTTLLPARLLPRWKDCALFVCCTHNCSASPLSLNPRLHARRSRRHPCCRDRTLSSTRLSLVVILAVVIVLSRPHAFPSPQADNTNSIPEPKRAKSCGVCWNDDPPRRCSVCKNSFYCVSHVNPSTGMSRDS
jgi:hypothetical protein